MRIKTATSYPYPIWGWKDDYTTPIREEDICITEISDKDDFVYELKLLARNKDIEALVAQDKAIYACIAYCPSTFKSYCFKSKESCFNIRIPRREVNNKVELKWMVLSTKAIANFESETLNADYEGHASFPLGAMMAYITTFEINPTICDELRSLDDIFVVVKNTDSNEISYDFSQRKIRIKLPAHLLEIFNDYGGKYPAAMHSTVVLQALILAIQKLADTDEDSELDWVFILKQYIDTMEDEDIAPIDEMENNEYSLEQSIRIANYILQNPINRMFEEIEQIESTSDSIEDANPS